MIGNLQDMFDMYYFWRYTVLKALLTSHLSKDING